MRPLESHVQMASHFMMYNRVKELLIREGWLETDSYGADVHLALERWVTMVEKAVGREDDHPHGT